MTYKELVKEAKRQGWRVHDKGGRRYVLLPPNGEGSGVVIHGSESDHRAMANTLARMRARGFRCG